MWNESFIRNLLVAEAWEKIKSNCKKRAQNVSKKAKGIMKWIYRNYECYKAHNRVKGKDTCSLQRAQSCLTKISRGALWAQSRAVRGWCSQTSSIIIDHFNCIGPFKRWHSLVSCRLQVLECRHNTKRLPSATNWWLYWQFRRSRKVHRFIALDALVIHWQVPIKDDDKINYVYPSSFTYGNTRMSIASRNAPATFHPHWILSALKFDVRRASFI